MTTMLGVALALTTASAGGAGLWLQWSAARRADQRRHQVISELARRARDSAPFAPTPDQRHRLEVERIIHAEGWDRLPDGTDWRHLPATTE